MKRKLEKLTTPIGDFYINRGLPDVALQLLDSDKEFITNIYENDPERIKWTLDRLKKIHSAGDLAEICVQSVTWGQSIEEVTETLVDVYNLNDYREEYEEEPWSVQDTIDYGVNRVGTTYFICDFDY